MSLLYPVFRLQDVLMGFSNSVFWLQGVFMGLFYSACCLHVVFVGFLCFELTCRLCLCVVCITQIDYFLIQNSLISLCSGVLVIFCQVGPEILCILRMNLML
jgi:hypothetical protein